MTNGTSLFHLYPSYSLFDDESVCCHFFIRPFSTPSSYFFNLLLEKISTGEASWKILEIGRFGLWTWTLEASHYGRPKAPFLFLYCHLFSISSDSRPKNGHSLPWPFNLDSPYVNRPLELEAKRSYITFSSRGKGCLLLDKMVWNIPHHFIHRMRWCGIFHTISS